MPTAPVPLHPFATHYQAPAWLPGGHLQTIWPALFARRRNGPPVVYRRERWTAPDGDFVDVDFADAPHSPGEAAGHRNAAGSAPPATTATAAATAVATGVATPAAPRPLLVLFHGLEGSSRSHYAEAFADVAREHGWDYAVPHFRGCSGEINLAPRAYHSGDHEEVGWVLARLRAQRAQPVVAVGVSLGGNALLRWAQEAGSTAAAVAHAVAAVCSPIDLAAGGRAIGRGFNRLVYTRMFLRTMKPKALAKLAQHPGLFDARALAAARDLYAFDDVFTAPLHGFRNADDYWQRASAQPHLERIRIPALVLNARNDPFVPAASLPDRHRSAGPQITLWQPAGGGHVGFPQGGPPAHVRAMPEAVAGWLGMRAGWLDSGSEAAGGSVIEPAGI